MFGDNEELGAVDKIPVSVSQKPYTIHLTCEKFWEKFSKSSENDLQEFIEEHNLNDSDLFLINFTDSQETHAYSVIGFENLRYHGIVKNFIETTGTGQFFTIVDGELVQLEKESITQNTLQHSKMILVGDESFMLLGRDDDEKMKNILTLFSNRCYLLLNENIQTLAHEDAVIDKECEKGEFIVLSPGLLTLKNNHTITVTGNNVAFGKNFQEFLQVTKASQ